MRGSVWTVGAVLWHLGRMPARVDTKVTISLDSLAHANRRGGELAKGNRSAVVEALLRLDARGLVPGLAEEVCAVLGEVKAGRAARGGATIEAARAARWPASDG